MMLNVCICDDESDLCVKLQSRIYQYAEHCGQAVRIRTYSDSSLLSGELEHSSPYQVYLLDILMPFVSGMELARQVRKKDVDAQIVFLTASPEFALEAYEVSACNYLIKPVTDEKLTKTLDMIFSNLEKQKEPHFLARSAGSIRSVSFSSIVYLESFRNHTTIHLNSGDAVDNMKSMGEMEAMLDEHPEFLRVHRSYIVNMNYIREINSGELHLAPDYHVPVSKTLQSSVRMSYFAFMERMV